MTSAESWRRERGSKTVALVAEYYAGHVPGWHDAAPVGSGRAGRDILNVTADIEVKARRGFGPMEWIRQWRRRRGEGLPEGDTLPGWVVMRPDGVDRLVGDYIVLQPLAEHTAMVAELLKSRALIQAYQDWQAEVTGRERARLQDRPRVRVEEDPFPQRLRLGEAAGLEARYGETKDQLS